MANTPWILTREMFLDEHELATLMASLARAVTHSRRDDRDSALLDQLIIAGLALSGLRNSEYCHLTLGDADLNPKRPVLRVSGTRTEDRDVAIPHDLARLLKHYIGGPRRRFLPADADPRNVTMPLVLTERSKPFDRTTLYRRVVKILSAHGLAERASVQLLRHTYGYLAYKRSGANLLFVQRQLGHAHPMVTAIYDQFVERDDAAVADKVAADLLPHAAED